MEELSLDFFMIFIPVIGVLEVLSVVFSIFFMHYSAKHRNYQLTLGWYICGVLFGFWTLIIFLIKRKDFPGPETKVCMQCGDKYPENFQMCSKCLIDLPVIDAEKKKKERKLSRVFGALIIITYIATLVVGIIMGIMFSESILNGDYLYDEWLDNRIAVDGVFYDKMGNSYDKWEDVLLYDGEGRTYTYTVEEIENPEDYIFYFADNYYVRDDGVKYFVYDCYVTGDGWFYCDKAGLLEIDSVDTDSMSEEELEEYYEGLIEASEEYKYYNYPYVDEDGNIYYCADEASWNEKGELITAENDITKK